MRGWSPPKTATSRCWPATACTPWAWRGSRSWAISTRCAELADVISLSAGAHAAGDAPLADAVWEAGAVAVGWGSTDGHEQASAPRGPGIPAPRRRSLPPRANAGEAGAPR